MRNWIQTQIFEEDHIEEYNYFRGLFKIRMRQLRDSLVKSRITKEKWDRKKKRLVTLREKFYKKSREAILQLRGTRANLRQQRRNVNRLHGLSARTIRRFPLLTADESHVGDQCSICMEDIDVGRRMRRLTCDGHHCFCQECIEGWFFEHKTCPLCRHVFV